MWERERMGRGMGMGMGVGMGMGNSPGTVTCIEFRNKKQELWSIPKAASLGIQTGEPARGEAPKFRESFGHGGLWEHSGLPSSCSRVVVVV